MVFRGVPAQLRDHPPIRLTPPHPANRCGCRGGRFPLAEVSRGVAFSEGFCFRFQFRSCTQCGDKASSLVVQRCQEKHGNIARARSGFEKGIELLGNELDEKCPWG